jgi:hypothetical protein
VIVEVGDEEIARPIHDHEARAVQPGVGGLAAIAGEAWRTGPGDGGDGSIGADLPNAIAVPLRDVEVAGRVQGHPTGPAHWGPSSSAIITGVAQGAGSRHGEDRPRLRGILLRSEGKANAEGGQRERGEG